MICKPRLEPRSNAGPFVLVALHAALLCACAGDPAGAGVSGSASETQSGLVDIPSVADIPVTKADNTAGEDSVDGPAQEGEFGWPCASNAECKHEWCVPTNAGKRCSQFCISSCPAEGWGCKPVPTLGGDEVFICLPLFPHLCTPCVQDDQCTTGLGELGDRCIPRPDGLGSFCGGDCSSKVACPPAYACVATAFPDGLAEQCVPESGECTCSQQAIASGATTSCSFENEHGKCTGSRQCLPAGLTDCSAATPALEICDGGTDNDCDGQTDEEDAPGCVEYFLDLDNDSFGTGGQPKCLCAPSGGYSAVQTGDCDDKNSTKSPGLTEKCSNGEDDDCDGSTDEAGAGGCVTYYADADEDGAGLAADFRCLCAATKPWTALVPGDCDDSNPAATPGKAETCGNGFDDDCNGLTDEAGAKGCQPYFLDNDKDGYGVAGESQCLCAPLGSYSAPAGGDCKDDDGEVSPGAAEACNGGDDDCDGELDEPGASGCVVHYEDGDKDGYGVESSTQCLCAPKAPFLTTVSGDCKDTNDEVNPGKSEKCNGVDDDCNDVVDDEGAKGCVDRWLDEDGDGFGVPGSQKCLCQPEGKQTAQKGGDCDDTDLLVFPDTVCIPASCTGHIFRSVTLCGGSGACDVGGKKAPCPGGYVCENEVSCKTSCTGDADCIPGNFCVAGACSGKKGTGEKCLDASECQSGYCGGGFCCAGGAGVECCGGDDSDCDDGNVCTDDICNDDFECESEDNGALCAVAFCDGNVYTAQKYCGAGACSTGGVSETCKSTAPCKFPSCTLGGCKLSNAPAGILCAAQSCEGYTLQGARLCDGEGSCAPTAIQTPCPGGLVCKSGAECLTACASNAQCQPGFFCLESSCVPKKGVGAPCASPAECVSGHCGSVEGPGSGFCCAAGQCCGGKALDCDDGNPCTTDGCSPAFQCVHAPNAAPCKAGSCDGLSFTKPALCADGECSAGAQTVSCAGANPCMVYGCTPAGCVETPLPIGTQCAAASCTGITLTTAQTCDGKGGCTYGGSVAKCPGGYACKDSSSCRTSCADHGSCAPGYYCKDGACHAKKADGETCSEDLPAACQSGHCDNGFCCASGTCCSKDTDCDDGDVCTTDTCSPVQKKCVTTFGTAQCAPGFCLGTKYTPPKKCQSGQCVASADPSECKGTLPCYTYGCGAGGCTNAPALAGTICKDSQCSGHMLTAATTCNGAGACSVGGGSAPCPGGFVCKSDGSGCTAACADDDGCQPTHFCAPGGSCQPRRSDGSPCTANVQCAGGYCNSGYCCASGKCCGGKASDCDDGNPCSTDSCNAAFVCKYAANKVACAPGTCDGLAYTHPKTCNAYLCSDGGGKQDCSGTDPCSVYSCSPAGGCSVANAGKGYLCQAPQCNGYTLMQARTCDGAGGCTQGGATTPCPGGYGCIDKTSCRLTCELDQHCSPLYFCTGGACLQRRKNGDACTTQSQCESGYCANGYCCDGPAGDCCAKTFHCDDGNPCTTDTCGTGFACKYTANTSVCQAPKCDGLWHTAPTYCAAKKCSDGGEVTNCAGTLPCHAYSCDPAFGCVDTHVSAGVQCAPQSCTGHYLTQAMTCNATGQCADGGLAAPCPGGFLCRADGIACESSCADGTGCQPGYYCQSKLCHPKRTNGDPCTVAMQCVSGYCSGGYCCTNDGNNSKCCVTLDQCSDSDPCTEDTCDAGNRCKWSQKSGNECGPATCDGQHVVTARICQEGACTGGASLQLCPSSTCITRQCISGQCVASYVQKGAPCEGSLCNDGWFLTATMTCDGTGQCTEGGGIGPCPGGLLCKDGQSCKKTCSSDADCQPGLYCAGTACLATKANGSQCGQNKECTSSYCSNGFCCTSGKCCQTAGHCSDGNVCTDDACVAYACKHTPNTAVCVPGECNGLLYTQPRVCSGGVCPTAATVQDCKGPNPCKAYGCTAAGCKETNTPEGSQCQAPSCEGFQLTQARTCNGGGSCNQGGTTAPCPGVLVCLNETQCRPICSVDAHCVAQHYCASGACLPKKQSGSTCGAGSECLSGYCQGSVCCAGGLCCTKNVHCEDGSPCTTNVCQNNQCAVYPNGDLCAAATCNDLVHIDAKFCASGQCSVGGATESCTGTNPCIAYGCQPSGCVKTPMQAGTWCAKPSCKDGVLTAQKTCSTLGDCTGGGAAGPCPGGYGCLSTEECRGTCTSGSHCAAGFYCQGGNCLAKKAGGALCVGSHECTSGWCANGFCCATGGICCAQNADCEDGNTCTDDICQNNACVFPEIQVKCADGYCAGLLYHAPMTCSGGKCSAGGTVTDCSGSDACKAYSCTEGGCSKANQPAGIQCQAPVCAGHTLTTARQCDGQGGCAAGGVTGPCPGSYVCKNSTQCHTTCAGDGECRPGYFCAGGACVATRPDGDPCASAGQCQSGYCNGGICCAGGTCCAGSGACNDGNPCTTDTCTGFVCHHANNSNQCTAGSCTSLLYTAPKFCQAGACTAGGAQADCSGSLPCYTYTCGNLSGCGTVPKESGTVCKAASCAGTTFTPASVCNGAGVCVGSTPVECDDGSSCNGAESCSTTAGCKPGAPPFVCGDETCHPSCEDAAGCPGDCACKAAYDLAPGEVDVWSTAAGGSVEQVSAYGCSASKYPGREHTYAFTAPIAGEVQAELRGADASTELMVLPGGGACDPAECIARAQGGGSSVTFTATAGSKWFLVVDRTAAGSTDFQVYVHYGVNTCNVPLLETWERGAFPRAFTAEPNWSAGVGAPFGPTHAQFSGSPVLTAFSRSLTSPVFDTTGCASTKLTFAWRFLSLAPHAGVFFRVEASGDGGATFTEVFAYDTGAGDHPESIETISSPVLSNTASARIRFRIQGDTTEHVNRFQVENVKVSKP